MVAVVVACCLLAPSLFAAEPTTGTIRGRITDASTGVGLASHSVRFDSTTATFWAMTAADGSFESPALPPGAYMVATSGQEDDYIEKLYPNVACPTTCPLAQGTPVPVVAGQATEGIDIALARGDSITGRVTGGGSPGADAWVYAYLPDGRSSAYARANANGEYRLGGLVPGEYRIAATRPLFTDELYDDIRIPRFRSYDTPVWNGTPVTVRAGEQTVGIDFDLEPSSASVTGRVIDSATGDPITGAWVEAQASSGLSRGTTRTDAGGWYRIEGLPSGQYRLCVESEGHVTAMYGGPALAQMFCPQPPTAGDLVAVGPGSAVMGIDFSLARGGRIAGVVRDETTGAPVWAQLDVRLVGGTADQWYGGWQDLLSGHYTVDGILPGRYYVIARPNAPHVAEVYPGVACAEDLCRSANGTPVTVAADTTVSGIDFEVGQGGVITGTVTAADTGLPLPDDRIGYVDIFEAQGRRACSIRAWGGSYSSPGLPPGTYYAITTGNKYSWVNELHHDVPCLGVGYPATTLDDCRLAAGTPIVVTKGAVSQVDFALSPGSYLEGRVAASSGAPLRDAEVRIFTADGQSLTRTRTNVNGQFYTEPVPAGSYLARTSNSAGYTDEVFDDVPCPGGICSVTAGTPIVTAGRWTPRLEFFLAERTGVRFHTVPPCRVLDTRLATGPTGGLPLQAGEERGFSIGGLCGVPASASAVAANLTVTSPTAPGHLVLFAAGAQAPLASTINFSPGQTRANNAALALGTSGGIRVRCNQPSGSGGTTHAIIDVFGYFE